MTEDTVAVPTVLADAWLYALDQQATPYRQTARNAPTAAEVAATKTARVRMAAAQLERHLRDALRPDDNGHAA